MAYNSTGGDIQSLGFLAANVIYQATGALISGNDAQDSDVWSDTVLILDVITSHYTETDDRFKAEMSAIEAEKQAARRRGYTPGGDDPSDVVLDTTFRQRESKAMFRSLCRAGVFVRIQAPSVEWKPNGAITQ